MKKIFLTIIVLAVVLSIAGAGSLAYFVDTETSAGNTFTAGTWGTDVGAGELSVTNPAPGASGNETWTVATSGTVPEYLDLENIEYAETGTGQLGDYLLVHLFVDNDGNGIFDVGDATIYGPDAPINGIDISYDLNLVVEGGDSTFITLNWNVSDAYVPGADDSVTCIINFEFELQPED